MAARTGIRCTSAASASSSWSRRDHTRYQVHPRREPEEQLLVPVFAPRELPVESAERRVGEAAGEQPEPFTASGLDDCRDEQTVQLSLGGGRSHERLQSLGVSISGVAPEHQAAALEQLKNPGEVAALLTREPWSSVDRYA